MMKVDELIAPILAKYAAEVPTIPLRNALRRCVHVARADALSMASKMLANTSAPGFDTRDCERLLTEEWRKELKAARR